jgi:hypothetical protein
MQVRCSEWNSQRCATPQAVAKTCRASRFEGRMWLSGEGGLAERAIGYLNSDKTLGCACLRPQTILL